MFDCGIKIFAKGYEITILRLWLIYILFIAIPVKIKWGQESYDKIEVDTDEEPIVFKAQLFALTGVEPHRQKVILKGAVLKDDPAGWDPLKTKMKNGVTLLMMGTKEEDIVTAPKEKPQVNATGRLSGCIGKEGGEPLNIT